jgi:hypothetical protein
MAPARQNPAKRKNKIRCIVNDRAKSSAYNSTSRRGLGDPSHKFVFIQEHTEVQEYHGRRGARGGEKGARGPGFGHFCWTMFRRADTRACARHADNFCWTKCLKCSSFAFKSMCPWMALPLSLNGPPRSLLGQVEPCQVGSSDQKSWRFT